MLRLYTYHGFNIAGSEWTHELTIDRDEDGTYRACITYEGAFSDDEGPWTSPLLRNGAELWDWLQTEWEAKTAVELDVAMKSEVHVSLNAFDSDLAQAFLARWQQAD